MQVSVLLVELDVLLLLLLVLAAPHLPLRDLALSVVALVGLG